VQPLHVQFPAEHILWSGANAFIFEQQQQQLQREKGSGWEKAGNRKEKGIRRGQEQSEVTIGDALESLSHFIFGSLAFVAFAILHYFYDSLRGQLGHRGRERVKAGGTGRLQLGAAARPATGHSYFLELIQTLTKTNREGHRAPSNINIGKLVKE